MLDKRILGKRLGQRIGQEAIVLGKITGKSSDDMSAEITTTDDARINVTFKEPFDFNNLMCYIEVHGIVKSKSTMSCSNFVCFPYNIIKDFDVTGYNTVMHTCCAVNNELEGAFHGD